jgi:hypothetical protein
MRIMPVFQTIDVDITIVESQTNGTLAKQSCWYLCIGTFTIHNTTNGLHNIVGAKKDSQLIFTYFSDMGFVLISFFK